MRETEALQRVLAALGGVPVPEHGASAPNGGDGIVAALRAGAYTATAVAEHAGVTPARACDTLGRLKAAGAVRRTGAGRGTHYRLVGDGRGRGHGREPAGDRDRAQGGLEADRGPGPERPGGQPVAQPVRG